MNAFVFATEQTPQEKMNGENHAFLLLEGRPLLLYVLMALDRVETIQKIFVIGPPKEVMRVIESVMFTLPFQKQIVVVTPKETLLDSLSAAQLQSAATRSSEETLPMISPPALFLLGNIPFVTTAEISTFVAAADLLNNDLCVSYARDGAFDFLELNHDEATAQLKISWPSSYGPYHLGRLFLARPGEMGKREALQQILALPVQTPCEKDQLEAFFKIIDLKMEEKEKTNPELGGITAKTSAFLNARLQLIETQTGGNTLPVHNTASYDFVSKHFETWRQHIGTLKSDQGEKICSISGAVCETDGHEH